MPGTSGQTGFYAVQGSLAPDAPSYVERPADRALMTALLDGEYCYVLTSRQMGKTSLLAHTRAHLTRAGHQVVNVDLAAHGTRLTLEQWYDALACRIGDELKLSEALETYWLDHERLGPIQRFFGMLRDVALPRLLPKPDGTPTRLYIFVDEIDTLTSLPFYPDEFLLAIHECYNARVDNPAFQHLSFCLSGVATLDKLIRDPTSTPLLFGQRIDLDDFPAESMPQLARGLPHDEAVAVALVRRVFDWTHGHPYLSQRLCQALASQPGLKSPAQVDALVEEVFLAPHARNQEPNLAFVRGTLLDCECTREGALQLLDSILHGTAVPDDEFNPVIAVLRQSGVVRVERGLLVIRNGIYRKAFTREWLRSLSEAQADAPPCTLAVLPFRDGAAEEPDYLCRGIMEEIIRRLGQQPTLRVLSSRSTFGIDAQGRDLRQIAHRLGANLLLQGAVRRVGSLIQLTADLACGDDGKHRWHGTFRRESAEWRLLPDDVCRGLLQHLDPAMEPHPARSTATHASPQSSDAFNAYLKGLQELRQRSEPALKRGLNCFAMALAGDPEFAPALAGQAACLILLGIYNHAAPHATCPRARETAARALALDPALADAHCALAAVHAIFDQNWPAAGTGFEQAIRLNRSFTTARQWMAVLYLAPLGRFAEAVDQLLEAQRCDPLSPSVPASLALVHHFASAPEESVASAELALEIRQDFWLPHLFLGWVHEQTHDNPKAAVHFEQAILLSRGDPAALASMAHFQARTGQTEAAVDRLNHLLAMTRTRYVAPAEIALVYAALQDRAEASHWLQAACDDHSFRLVYARVDPRFKAFAGDPLYDRMLQRLPFERVPEGPDQI